MTPKEKAKELFKKFLKRTTVSNSKMIPKSFTNTEINTAKQCALICVDEILSAMDIPSIETLVHDLVYWYRVKQEIEKL